MDETEELKFRLESFAHYPYIIILWVSRPPKYYKDSVWLKFELFE